MKLLVALVSLVLVIVNLEGAPVNNKFIPHKRLMRQRIDQTLKNARISGNTPLLIRGRRARVTEYDIIEFEEEKSNRNPNGDRSKRATIHTSSQWADGIIPYSVDNIPEDLKINFTVAVNEWEENTCITFKEREDEDDYTTIYHYPNEGCASTIGYNTAWNTINIADVHGCDMPHIWMHELGHTIGLYHEHTRKDRNNSVLIHWENINKTDQDNFVIKPEAGTENKYDFLSIMHYGTTFFSNNTNQTIEPLPEFKAYTNVTGRASTPSFVDYQAVNAMYNCAGACADTDPCPNDGYRRKDCKCYCSVDDGESTALCSGEDVPETTAQPEATISTDAGVAETTAQPEPSTSGVAETTAQPEPSTSGVAETTAQPETSTSGCKTDKEEKRCTKMCKQNGRGNQKYCADVCKSTC